MKKVFRRGTPRFAVFFVLMALFCNTGLTSALAQTAPANPTKVFFSECGHYLADRMLSYWRTHGREQAFGCPVTEEFFNGINGGSFQYFSKARIEYHPESAGTPWEYSLGLIGAEVYRAMSPDEKANSAYKKIEPFTTTKERTYYSETGHSLANGFKEFWTANTGLYTYGLPISEEYSAGDGDKSYAAQDFERARLYYSPATGIFLTNLGKSAAEVNKVVTAPLTKDDSVPAYSPALWEHWVEVNLSSQTVFFWEGDTMVRKNLVTTGKAGHETPTGTFYVLRRVYNERMKGGSIGSEDYYDLDNVLNTQYFTGEGHALHYAWWRSSFGYPGSHGCVNMDLSTSAFAWNWFGIGGRIVIHY